MTGHKPDGSSQPAIIYFDATNRRKEKIRLGAKTIAAANDRADADSLSSGLLPPAESWPPDQTLRGSNTVSNGQKMESNETSSPDMIESNNRLTRESLSSFLINFVIEQTGYPSDFVEMDADLEADLGIDSIQIAQMFGELHEQYGVRAKNDAGLDDFLTLQHVVDYLLPARP